MKDENHLRKAVTDAVMAVLPGISASQVTPSLSLRELGADSVDCVEIFAMLESSLGVDMDIAEFAEAADIRALTDMIERRVSESR